MSPLPMLGATLSLKKSETGNNNNNINTNNGHSQRRHDTETKNATHTPFDVYQENKRNNNNELKNFHGDVENVVEKVNNSKSEAFLVRNEAERKLLPTNAHNQQEPHQNHQLVNKNQIYIKTTEPTMATATCDSSNNNTKSTNTNKSHISVLDNGISDNNNHEPNNKNNNCSNNSITADEVQIKIEECDESIEIKAEEIESVCESSSSISPESAVSSVNGTNVTATAPASMQLIKANNDNGKQIQEKQLNPTPDHDDNNETKSRQPSGSDSASASSSTNGSTANNSSTSKNSNSNTTLSSVIAAVAQQKDHPNDAANDLIFARPKPVLLTDVNPHIICNLCYGYLIDATTIVECLHSFCHSCLIKHLRTEQYCPRCEMMINTAKPNIKSDTTLQAIVHKLVPGLYEKERMRRRAFYKNRPEEAALATPEQRGDDTEDLIFSPSEYMSLSLEYADIDNQINSNPEYSELLRPRYLKCPAKFTVAHMKKFVLSKFSIDSKRFDIDIMYKVKTILLLDHYTVMDIAYIYTWKRDAPMRFFFSVKQSIKPMIKQEQQSAKEIGQANSNSSYDNRMMTVIHSPITPGVSSPPSSSSTAKLLPLTAIKVEEETENLPTPSVQKHFEIVSPRSAVDNKSHTSTDVDNLKITIVSKTIKDAKSSANSSCTTSSSNMEAESVNKSVKSSLHKEKRVCFGANATEQSTSPKEERKIENIKLKIDLSKQSSVTIINMSDPARKEIVKPVRTSEKEWKVKNKQQDKELKNLTKSTTANGKTTTATTHLTVPPLTLNRSPSTKTSPKQPEKQIPEEDKKSQFLKSFALAPIASVKNGDLTKKASSKLPEPASTQSLVSPKQQQQSPPKSKSLAEFVFKEPAKPASLPLLPKIFPLIQASKRKIKEPTKTVSKKPKMQTQQTNSLADNNTNSKTKCDFKIKLPAKDSISSTATAVSSNKNKLSSEQLMPPPSSLPLKRPSISPAPKKASKASTLNSKIQTNSNGITPHPTLPGVQVAAPGNRTPIAKRYQPILPKANPFADLPSSYNQIFIDNGTEINSIPLEGNGNASGKTPATSPTTNFTNNTSKLMGPPPLPKQKLTSTSTAKSTPSTSTPTISKPIATSPSSAAANSKSYLNYALFNANKTKGNEVPPGCRTPMYSPNSPIYSPNSPQYAPSYNIPTVPQYKYTPKPSSSSSSESILQSILGGNNAMSGLFPSPPVKKVSSSEALNNQQVPSSISNANQSNSPTSKKLDSPQQHQQNSTTFKRPYPFQRSPNPKEDPPEKQLKVKSLLTSCNINIPSSLSITITRDDGEAQANSVSHPKHKNPVNNYIEILKLPDTSNDANCNIPNKRQSPPANVSLPFKPTQPATTTNSLSTTLKNFRPNNNRTTPPPSQPPAAAAAANNVPAGKPQQLQQLPPPKVTSPPTSNTLTVPSADGSRLNQIKPPNSIPTHQTEIKTTPSPKTSPFSESNPKSPNQKITQNDKKTPSPEKRPSMPMTPTNSPPTDNKLSGGKLVNSNADGSKKFRPILPRFPQAPTPATTENSQQKISNSNVIGTYSSPSGVTVNVHGPKKVQAPKKSPNMQMPKTNSYNAQPTNQQQNQQQHQRQKANQHSQSNLTIQQQNSANAFKSGVPRTIASSRYSPTANKQIAQSNTLQAAKQTPLPKSASPKNMPKQITNSTPPAPTLSQQQQQLPSPTPTKASVPATALPTTSQQNAAAITQLTAHQSTDFTKLFKENLLRAQVHAAAAANPAANMLYTYANAAAAAQIYNAPPPQTLYSYQQAYILEQIQRMQRANNDALICEYLQKLQASNIFKTEAQLNQERNSNNSNAPSTSTTNTGLQMANARKDFVEEPTAAIQKNRSKSPAGVGVNNDASQTQANKAK